MKLLFICEFFPDSKDLRFSGGVEARDFFVSQRLAKKNQVTILTSSLENLPEREKFGKLEIFRVGKKRFYRASVGNLWERVNFIKEAIKVGKKLDVDLVEGSNFISHFIAFEIARKKKIPSVAWYPDVWVGEWIRNAGMVGIFGEVLERFNLWRGFDDFIAISGQTAKKLKKFTSKKLSVIPCGVDVSEFKARIKKFETPTIISIGRLVTYKNHQITIEALSQLLDLKWNFLIIGNGPLKNKLEVLAFKKGLKKRIKFLGNIPRKSLVKNLSSSSIFVLMSKVEGFGIAVIEAAAAGVPYVVSNIEINKEISEGGRGGFLVEEDDSKKVAEKIRLLLNDKKIYDKKSREARELSKNYSWDKIADQTEKIFERVKNENFNGN